MNRFILTICMLLISSLPVMASPASHRQAAEELLTISGMKNSMDRIIVQMVEMQLSQKPMLSPYREVLLQFFNKYLGFNSIKYDFIDIYIEEFSEQELKAITDFYKTPVGKKTITKLPVLMQKGAQVGMTKVKMHQEELREMLQAETKKNEAKKQSEEKSKETTK